MVTRAAYDLGRVALKIAIQLWPLWLFWFALQLGGDLWLNRVLLTQPDRSTKVYALLYEASPSVRLAGPIALMLAAIGLHRLQIASRTMAIAGIAGVVIATVIVVWSE